MMNTVRRRGTRSLDRRLAGVSTIFVVAAFSVLGAGCDKEITDRDVKRVSVAELRVLVAKAEKKPESGVLLLIDPRSPNEFAQGHLPGARNIQLSVLPPNKDADPMFFRPDHVIVYGNNPASTLAKGMTKRLLQVDVNRARFFAGGVDEWAKTGGALVTSEPPQKPTRSPK
jgi:rhodanese-related sulfurtransferase